MSGSAPAAPPSLPRLDLRGVEPGRVGERLEAWASDMGRTLQAEFARISAQRLLTTRGVMQGPLLLWRDAVEAVEAVPLRMLNAATAAGAAALAAEVAALEADVAALESGKLSKIANDSTAGSITVNGGSVRAVGSTTWNADLQVEAGGNLWSLYGDRTDGFCGLYDNTADQSHAVFFQDRLTDFRGPVQQEAPYSFVESCQAAMNGTGTTGVLTGGTEVYGLGSIYNSSNGRFTAPVTGRYLVSFHGITESGVAAAAEVRANVNGVQKTRGYMDNPSAYFLSFSLCAVVSLAANDYVEFSKTAGAIHTNAFPYRLVRFLG